MVPFFLEVIKMGKLVTMATLNEARNILDYFHDYRYFNKNKS